MVYLRTFTKIFNPNLMICFRVFKLTVSAKFYYGGIVQIENGKIMLDRPTSILCFRLYI